MSPWKAAAVAVMLVGVGLVVFVNLLSLGKGGTGERVAFRGIAVTVPETWDVVRFDGTQRQCVGTETGTAFVGEPPDSETCNLAHLPGPSVWLLDLDVDAERAGAPEVPVGELVGYRYVDEEDRIGTALPDDDVYILVSRSAADVLVTVRRADPP